MGTIGLGYLFQRLAGASTPAAATRLPAASRSLKLASFFFMNPIAILSTFWAMRLPEPGVLLFPVLGLLSVLVGVAGAMAAIRLIGFTPFRAASVFTCGVFSNVVTFGGLIVFTLFGEPGYVLVQLFTVLISPTYYMIGYPVSSNIARGRSRVFRISADNLRENPYLAIPLASIAAGILLRASGIPRPAFLGVAVGVLVPCVAAALGIAIGLTLRFSRIRGYGAEILAVVGIRHVLVPAVTIPLAAAMGMGSVAGGLPMKVAIILAVMPVAFNALVPPAIYGFDLDLANSAWLVSTASLAVSLPILFAVLA